MTGQQARVLVVDDAQVMRRAVEKMLQTDYEVILANDGEAGWEMLAQDASIDMLITDVQMPKLDGYGLICRVRADGSSHLRELPIITITGAEDDETRIRAFACGSTDFIIKPFDRKLLQSRVHAYLRLKQASLLNSSTNTGSANVTDGLTQLNGLGAFVKRGKDYFQQVQDGNRDLAIIAFDVDDFAGLKRELGESAADQVLVSVAQILKSAAGGDAFAARVGESEFALLLPNNDRDKAAALCERLRVRIPAEAANGAASVTASFGVASFGTDASETFEKLLVLVEQRLSQARSDGGNRVGLTLLSDVMPEAEEVELTAVPDSAGSSDAAPSLEGIEVEVSEVPGDLSIAELEAMVRDEAARGKGAR